MVNMRFPKIIIGIVVVTSLWTGFNLSHAGAQAANANAAQGMQISPTLVNLKAEKGKTYEITIGVTNVTGSDLLYTTSVADFGAGGETGSPRIITDSKLPATASITSWVTAVPEFTLEPHKTRMVTAQVAIPNNAEPGGHYGVLQFSGTAPKLESTGVGLSASAGVLILIRVGSDSEIVEKASLASFYTSATQSGNQNSFFENGPVSFITRIKNEGNVHIQPVGNIEVRDMFGGLVKNLPVNKDKSNVLPNSIRRFDEQKLDKPWMFGLYTVNLTLGYGTTGQAITNTISFWVIPWKIILAALLVLATVIFILRRMIKVYNRRIIEKHKNENKNKKHTKKKD